MFSWQYQTKINDLNLSSFLFTRTMKKIYDCATEGMASPHPPRNFLVLDKTHEPTIANELRRLLTNATIFFKFPKICSTIS